MPLSRPHLSLFGELEGSGGVELASAELLKLRQGGQQLSDGPLSLPFAGTLHGRFEVCLQGDGVVKTRLMGRLERLVAEQGQQLLDVVGAEPGGVGGRGLGEMRWRVAQTVLVVARVPRSAVAGGVPLRYRAWASWTFTG